MTPDDTIDVTGIDPWELLVALYNGTQVAPGVGAILASGHAPTVLTPRVAKEEAQSGLYEEYFERAGVPFWPDYIFGRPIKAMLKKEGEKTLLTRGFFYDRDAGQGQCERVIGCLKGESR